MIVAKKTVLLHFCALRMTLFAFYFLLLPCWQVPSFFPLFVNIGFYMLGNFTKRIQHGQERSAGIVRWYSLVFNLVQGWKQAALCVFSLFVCGTRGSAQSGAECRSLTGFATKWSWPKTITASGWSHEHRHVQIASHSNTRRAFFAIALLDQLIELLMRCSSCCSLHKRRSHVNGSIQFLLERGPCFQDPNGGLEFGGK